MNKNNIFDLVVLVGLAILLIVLYCVFRVYTSTGYTTQSYFSDNVRIAGVRCPIPGDPIEQTRGGVMYVSGSRMRIDWERSIKGVRSMAHAVSLDGDMVYTWNDQDMQPVIASSSVFVQYFINPKSPEGSCRTWWIPRSTTFEIPNTLDFVPFRITPTTTPDRMNV